MSSNYDLEKAKRMARIRVSCKGAVDEILDHVNDISSDASKAAVEGMLEGLTKNHRTLQQSFVSTLVEVINGYADTNHDARNEAAVKWAKDVRDNVNPKHYFPFI